jgi:hypothetical protein
MLTNLIGSSTKIVALLEYVHLIALAASSSVILDQCIAREDTR